MALHFVSFGDDRYWNAVKVFGKPDFYHRTWDRRARAEIVEGDIAVFAVGSIEDEPKPIGWDDSQEDIISRPGGKEAIGLGKTKGKRRENHR